MCTNKSSLCNNFKKMPTDYFTQSDTCYELADYPVYDSKNPSRYYKITLKQDTSQTSEILYGVSTEQTCIQ